MQIVKGNILLPRIILTPSRIVALRLYVGRETGMGACVQDDDDPSKTCRYL
jgi:hypothetical protein